MKLISCENFSLQSPTLSATATTDTIYKCLNSGKEYYWTGSAFAEYFKFSQGGNITVTPLNQTLQRASISDRKVIDTPFSVEPINNINLITGAYAMPTSGVYARSFIAPHTGLYSNVEVMVSAIAAGSIQWAIYNMSGYLLGETSTIADSSSGSGWNGASFWYDSNHAMKSVCGVRLTGGEAYFLAMRCSSTSTTFFGYNNLPTVTIPGSKNPLQAFSSTIPANQISMPSTLTPNGSNIAIFPWIKLEIIA